MISLNSGDIFDICEAIAAIICCLTLKKKKVDVSHQIIVKYIAAIFYTLLMRHMNDKRRVLGVRKIMARHHFHNLFRQFLFVAVQASEEPLAKGVNLNFTRCTEHVWVHRFTGFDIFILEFSANIKVTGFHFVFTIFCERLKI